MPDLRDLRGAERISEPLALKANCGCVIEERETLDAPISSSTSYVEASQLVREGTSAPTFEQETT
jgi:hypothetical protein